MGLDNKYIVISDADEWIYCLNLDTGEVSSWDAIEKKYIIESKKLFNFMLNELEEAKEDWE